MRTPVAIACAVLALTSGCQRAADNTTPAADHVSAGGGIGADAWRIPADVGGAASDADWIRHGWQSFVALNWPAGTKWPNAGQGGMPDKTMTITDPRAAARPVVWQTYLAPGQAFRENGQDPGPWDAPVVPFTSRPDPRDASRSLPVLGGFAEKSIYFLTQNPDFGLALFDLATTPNPVVDQHGNYVLLEVRLNQREFEYFRQTRYYDTCRQLEDTRAPSGGTFRYLPDAADTSLPEWAQQGAVEIKASWRILDETWDITRRYFTIRAFYLKPNGEVSEPVTLGLTGLHILQNTPRSTSTWFWTTFEHVDNVRIAERPVPTRPNGQPLAPSFNPGPAGAEPSYVYGFDMTDRFQYNLLASDEAHYNPVTQPAMLSAGDVIPRTPPDRPVPASRVIPIRGAVQRMNAEYQAKLKGSVWQYYEMIDVLYPDPNGMSEVLKSNDKHFSPKLLINAPALVNTTMETYLAYKYSTWSLDTCQSCHYNAKPHVAEGIYGETLAPPQVFSYLYRRATPSRALDAAGMCQPK